jgi:hypothetical protein
MDSPKGECTSFVNPNQKIANINKIILMMKKMVVILYIVVLGIAFLVMHYQPPLTAIN